MNFEILEVIAAPPFKVNPGDLGRSSGSSHRQKTVGIVNPVFTGTGIPLGCLKMKSLKGVGIKFSAENSVTDLLHDFEEGILTCLCQFSHL